MLIGKSAVINMYARIKLTWGATLLRLMETAHGLCFIKSPSALSLSRKSTTMTAATLELLQAMCEILSANALNILCTGNKSRTEDAYDADNPLN